jgi:hypothetical protein
MRLYFSGTEVFYHRKFLAENGVQDVGFSYVGWRRRPYKQHKTWSFADHYPGHQHIFLDSGGYSVNKEETEYSHDELAELAEDYFAFCCSNVTRLDMLAEFDALSLGKDWIAAQRDKFKHAFGDKFLPVWHSEAGIAELENLARNYHRVGIIKIDVFNRDLTPILNGLVARHGVKLHGLGITSMEAMREIAWDSVGSTSWLSTLQYGDTFVWTGRELKRYPKKYKERARKQHRSLFMTHGFDAAKIAADDTNEILKLSIWSWQSFVESLSPKVVTNNPKSRNPENSENNILAVMNVDSSREHRLQTTRQTTSLPIMGISLRQDDESDTEIPFLHKRSDSMRACNNCFLRDKCPGFEADASCLYNIPIDIKTTDQLRALQDALITMQAQRVLFMQMAEDMEGGYADPNLSAEIDRLQRLIKSRNDAERTGFSVSVSASEPGVISRIFGPEAGMKAQAIEPVHADALIQKAMVYDAEIVEPKNAS